MNNKLHLYKLSLFSRIYLIILIFCQLLRIDANPIEEWVSKYDRAGNDDRACDIKVDINGNVYITGYTTFPGTTYDYTTIKYNSSGLEEWIAIYNYVDYDLAKAIEVDNLGNVYVTGESDNQPGTSFTSYDYATIKYNNAGVQQWIARYNSPGNADDVAIDIALDENGNVYVTGRSHYLSNLFDYLTIKYNSSGIEQWTVRYNGIGNGNDIPHALVVDSIGNVYVTGESLAGDGYVDCLTIKYNTNGVEQWTARYNGIGGGNDIANDIAIDKNNNIYITGSSIGSSAYYDYITIKYNNNGEEQWVERFNGSGNRSDTANAIALDSYGSVFVTGDSFSTGSSHDYVTIKYNSDGVEQWVNRYNGTGNGADQPSDITIDYSDNVYITGRSDSSGAYLWDVVTLKYDNSGTLKWEKSYNSMETNEDKGIAITTDIKDNVYITGYTYNPGFYYDFLTIKYSQSVSTDDLWINY